MYFFLTKLIITIIVIIIVEYVGIVSVFVYHLTLVLLKCFNCIFRHLKLELLTQFPASNDEKCYYLLKIDMSEIKLLDQQSVY